VGGPSRVLAVDSSLGRLAQTPRELADTLEGRTDDQLARRPDAQNWSATAIICHLRDVEELFQIRFHTILAVHEPTIFVLGASASELAPWRVGGAIGHPLDPARWAEERQYARNDPREALAPSRAAARTC
jgi:DinB superfamily